MHTKFDYSKIPLPDYQSLGMRNREPKSEHLKQGWNPKKWANEITIFCCNFCPYDSPVLADTVQHLFLRHWLPQMHEKPQIEVAPAPVKSMEEQLAEADQLLENTFQELLNTGEITEEALKEWQES